MDDIAVHFSSKTDMWSTPQDFFDKLDAIYHFRTDVCATHDNAKCAHYYTLEEDGLKQEWGGVCWMNPPYGREIGKWMRKAYESSLMGATVVCLVPARTDTRWWHDYAMKGRIEFIKGRLKFGGSENSAPFPNAVVVFQQNPDVLQPSQFDHFRDVTKMIQKQDDQKPNVQKCLDDGYADVLNHERNIRDVL